MDLRGITWVGNVYQKFEAMCLEVEDIMYQDTVKYVENQVQTVGASVKKFYSDVMLDVLPPSSVDLVKVAATDLSLSSYSHIEIYKKPKENIMEDPIEVDQQSATDFNVIAGMDDRHTSSFGRLCNVNNTPPSFASGSVKGAHSLSYSVKCKGAGISEGPDLVVEGNARDIHPLSETSRSIIPASEDWSQVSSFYEIKGNHVACDQIATLSPSASVRRCESRKEDDFFFNHTLNANVSIADASTDSPTPVVILLGESGRQKLTDVRSTLSSYGLSLESTAGASCRISGLASQIGPNISMDAQSSGFVVEEVFMSNAELGGFNTDVTENNDTVGLAADTIEEFGKSKLEETCILVDGEKLPFVSQWDGTHKSYKKKIREAFSSKMRSSRKQEYEQLAAKYGDIDTKLSRSSTENVMPALTMDSHPKKLPTYGLCESEWELL